MKKIINTLTFSLFFIVINSFASNNVEEKNELINSLDIKISSLIKNIDDLSNRQQKLNIAIDKSRALQTDINFTTSNLINYIEGTYSTDKSIPIKISQETNWYPYLLPLITIFIVITTTFLSLRTIAIKSKESIAVLKDSNKTQVDINNKNILEEHRRTQKEIIANNRQAWINILRDEISMLLSIIGSTSINNAISKIEQEKLWLHLYKIELMLNPKESKHRNLLTQMHNEIKSIISGVPQSTNIENIIISSKSILKEEWERVKKFE